MNITTQDESSRVLPPGESEDAFLLRLSMNISPETDRFITRLAEDMNNRPPVVILKALGLLRAALDAKQAGKHVGIYDEDGMIEEELTGF